MRAARRLGPRRTPRAHRGLGVNVSGRSQLIVAVEPDELPRLHTLYERGRANGVAGLAFEFGGFGAEAFGRAAAGGLGFMAAQGG